MPRESKLTDTVRKRVREALEAGNTRKAACAHARVSEDSFARYLKADEEFAASVAAAEAACEREMVGIIRAAADGVETKSTTRRAHDVVKQRKTRRPVIEVRRTTYPDGRVVEEPVRVGEEILDEPVTVTLRSAETVEAIERDWRAALEILKRRYRVDWGDRARIDLGDLTDDQLLALLGAESRPAADAPESQSAAGAEGAPGTGGGATGAGTA